MKKYIQCPYQLCEHFNKGAIPPNVCRKNCLRGVRYNPEIGNQKIPNHVEDLFTDLK